MEETYFIPNAIAYPLICMVTIFNNPTIFEHLEMSSRAIALPNPPIENFYPTAPEPKLRNYQIYDLAWLEPRAEHGGGIFGDHIGLGKVPHCMTKINM